MEIKVKCTQLDKQARGVFEIQGKTQSCPNLLPFETAWVEKKKNRWQVNRILEASDQRLEHFCPQFQRCGGCQFQHASRNLEYQWKQERIETLFPKVKIEPIVRYEEDNYRHKVIATFATDKNKKITAGIYEEDSHRVCPVQDCRIQHEKVNAILQSLLRLLNEMHYTAYDEDTRRGLLRHCLFRVSHYYNEVLLCFVTAEKVFPGSRNLVERLRKLHPEIKTVIQNVNSRSTSVVLGTEEKVLYGTGMIQDQLLGLNFLIGSKTFYQINPKQTEKLYDLALTMADIQKTDVVLDAYCGIGTISLLAAKRAKQVIGVEINPASIQNAKKNAARNKIQNVFFYAMDCGVYMLQAAKEKLVFDCVIMDPAREGSSFEFLSSMVKLKPKKVVYISCGPDTQKRDVDFLLKNGYSIVKIQPVDLFPRTVHIENIVCLKKK